MITYKVTIVESAEYIVDVNASSEEEAIELAYSEYCDKDMVAVLDRYVADVERGDDDEVESNVQSDN